MMDNARRLLLVVSLGLLATGAAGAATLGLDSQGPATSSSALALQAPISLRVAPCLVVEVGDTFTVDIRGANVTKLLAWEIYFAYDRTILEVVDRDVRVFLDALPGSSLVDLSDPIPNTTGLYRMAAADLGSKDALESGSGILVRVTLAARGSGVSHSTIALLDFNGDGVDDLGPTLTGMDESGEIVHLGDTENDDGLFDGIISNGQIAVDAPCLTPVPEPSVEDILVTQPSIATPVGPPLPEQREPEGPGPGDVGPNGATPQAGTPSGDATGFETPGPAPGQTPGPDQTPGAEATPGSPAAASNSGNSGSVGSAGDGFPTWLIAAILVLAGLGLAFGLAIIRLTRRAV